MKPSKILGIITAVFLLETACTTEGASTSEKTTGSGNGESTPSAPVAPAPSEESDPSTPVLPEPSEPDPAPVKPSQDAADTVIWTGSTDFNDTDWKINIQINKNNFSSAAKGTVIQIYWQDSRTAHEYKKLQLDSMKTPWGELTDGAISGGEKESGANSAGIKPTSNPVSYTLTEANARELRENGLAIMGYGVIVTKVTIGSGNDDSAPSSQPDADLSNVPVKVKPVSETGTPFANHGKLHVAGTKLKDAKNNDYMLYGMSTHGLTFGNDFSKYVCEETFTEMVDVWNTNCIRLVLYPEDYNGYCNGGNQSDLKALMKKGIDLATAKGMYVIVDWHVHAFNPNNHKEEAKVFLGEIAKEYQNYDNVLYEICNEPTGSPWATAIKPYAEEVIPSIREYAKDAVIIVGTNTWSQDINEAYNSLLDVSKYGNIMYTFHFYAGSHQNLYSMFEEYIKKMPVFVTEFGTCDASGNGGFNKEESEKWLKLCKENSISHMNWSLSTKAETASAIASWSTKLSGWTDNELTDSGKLIKKHFTSLTR